MTLEDYLNDGGVREDKLVTVFHLAPDKLSRDYYSVIHALTCKNRTVRDRVAQAFPELADAQSKWDAGELPPLDLTVES